MTEQTQTQEQAQEPIDIKYDPCISSDAKKRAFLAAIRHLRKEACLTQSVLARKLGKPQSYVSKYERGERGLRFTEALDIAAHCGYRGDEFCSLYQTSLDEAQC